MPQVSAIHFPRPAIRQVRCNTLLSGCQPPWPPPCCPYRDRTFAPCPASGHLSPSEVHSSLRPMLTTGRPLARARYTPYVNHSIHTFGVYRLVSTSSLPHPPARAPLSCETFRREPATRQFVWSFAPMPMSCHRVEHQNGSGRPPAFPRGSASTGIVHCLSGPTTPTRRSPAAHNLIVRLAGAVVSLVRVSIRVRVLGLRPCTFTFHLHTEPFHISLAVLLRYRPPPCI